MVTIRPAAVAGAFYPADPASLALEVEECLRGARKARAGERPPKAIVAPHAGYVYSGPVAASAYARIAPLRGKVTRVVLAGPAHRVHVRGAAVPKAGAFATPLGEIALDEEALARLRRLAFVESSDHAHALEHSLEVHLPFLQAVLGDSGWSRRVGGACGRRCPSCGGSLGRRGDVIVVSSDLSHFLHYAAALAGAIATRRLGPRALARLDRRMPAAPRGYGLLRWRDGRL